MNTKNVESSLDSFKLYYEDMEKKVKTTKSTVKSSTSAVKAKAVPKVSLKSRISAKLAPVRGRINNVFKKLKPQRKTAKKMTKNEKLLAKQERNRGILGIGLLLVVVSITFSTFVAIKFVNGVAIYVALAPQIVFAAVSLFKAFSKIYK